MVVGRVLDWKRVSLVVSPKAEARDVLAKKDIVVLVTRGGGGALGW